MSVTPTQPTPEEQVEARRKFRELLGEIIDADTPEARDRAWDELENSYLALLTRQSQERAEIRRLNRALFVAGKRITADEAELDRAVERAREAREQINEARALIRWRGWHAPKRRDQQVLRGAMDTTFDILTHALGMLAASPGKGAEGECHGNCGVEYANFNCPKCRDPEAALNTGEPADG